MSSGRSAQRRSAWKRAWEREAGRCFYCERKVSQAGVHPWLSHHATLDHVVPVSQGGGSAAGNLVLACLACNERKGDRQAEEFLNDTQIFRTAPTAAKMQALEDAPQKAQVA